MKPVFDAHGQAVQELLVAGVSAADVARERGIGERTIKSWLTKGRQDPDGRYGPFARAVDAARAERVLPPAEVRKHMDVDELLGVLEHAARAGNVAAAKHLLDRADRRRDVEPPAAGGILDELEQRRARGA